MAYGITMENDGNELTLTDMSITYGYVGRASNYSLTQATGTDYGFTTYSIDWAGPDILVAIELRTDVKCTLLGKSRSGNTWYINVASGRGNTTGFEQPEFIEVHVFGAPGGITTTYGAAIYDDSGTKMLADLSKPPLTFARISIPDPGGTNEATFSAAIPAGVIKPAIIGYPTGRRQTSVRQGNFWVNRTFFVGWMLSSNNNRIGVQFIQRTYDGRSDGGISTITDMYPTIGLVVDIGRY